MLAVLVGFTAALAGLYLLVAYLVAPEAGLAVTLLAGGALLVAGGLLVDF